MTENFTDMRRKIIELIKKSNNILIGASGPDGDSVGAAGALSILLKKMGKEVTVIAPSRISDEFKFLPFASEIQDNLDDKVNNDLVVEVDCDGSEVGNLKYEMKNGKLHIILSPLSGKLDADKISLHNGGMPFDMMITVDTGDRHQLGKLHTDYAELFDKLTVVNIDHHSSNSKFGDINYVDIGAASTTEVVYPLLEDLQADFGQNLIDEDIATLLYAGLVADTGCFIHANTSTSALKLASKLLSQGARQQEIIKHFYKTKPLAQLKLWGNTLNKLQFDPTYKIAWSSVNSEDLRKCDAELDHSEGIIDELMTNVPGTLVAILLKEKEPGLISGSLRSTTNDADVSRIAQIFNGGGHVRAAGFRYKYEGSFEAAEEQILARVRKDLAEQMDISKKAQSGSDSQIQKLSIEVNGQRYDFSEEDIKEMAMNFLLSDKKLVPSDEEKLDRSTIPNSEKAQTSSTQELAEGEEADLKKYYKFEE